MSNQYDFQYCQKIIVLSKDMKKVLLCKRKGEEDFDGIYSFIGGKMEITDSSIINGLKREKDEEVGTDFKIKLYPKFSYNISYIKTDGKSMILPNYLAIYDSGEINLNEEYSEYKWVPINNLNEFEPKIDTISEIVTEIFKLNEIIDEEDFVLI